MKKCQGIRTENDFCFRCYKKVNDGITELVKHTMMYYNLRITNQNENIMSQADQKGLEIMDKTCRRLPNETDFGNGNNQFTFK